MNRVLRTPQAQADLTAIWRHIAAANDRAADQLLDAFELAANRLAEFPGMGSQRDELRPGLRSWPVGNYLIFYRPTDNGIEIIRVLHGARNLPRLL